MEFLTPVAELVTILIAVVTLTIAAFRPYKRLRFYLLGTPFRRVLKNPKSWGLDELAIYETFDLNPKPTRYRIKKTARTFVKELVDPLSRSVDEEGLLAADFLSQIDSISSRSQNKSVCNEYALLLSSFLKAASTSRAQSLLSGLLYPGDSRGTREALIHVIQHLEKFGYSSPVESGGEFADFATALSGALILADSVDSRSRYANEVFCWHRREFRHADDGAGESGSAIRTYENKHTGGNPCSLAGSIEDRKIGDYDRRVLDLQSVSHIQSSSLGWTAFLVDTSETCYLTTEQGEAVQREPKPQAAVGCKHLLPSDSDSNMPRFMATRTEAGNKNGIIKKVDDPKSPVVLLTTYVSLITRDQKLALVKRSSSVRHGFETLSATAGGVIEPEGAGPTGDVDGQGMPSPLVSVLRETHEEIGLKLDPQSLKPVVIFLSNVRTSRNVDSEPSSNNQPRSGRGQIVAVVLYLAHTRETFEDLELALTHANLALGSFEVDKLVSVDLRTGDTARGLAEWAKQNSSELDQHGLLSCLYTAATLDGPITAKDAFQKAFYDRPWWAPDEVNGIRLVRDPRSLVEPKNMSLHTDAHIDQAGPEKEWKKSWDALKADLKKARNEMENGLSK